MRRSDRNSYDLCRRLTLALSVFALFSLSRVAFANEPENLSIFDPVTPNATGIRDLFTLILWITGGIFVAVEGALIYCIVRFYRGRQDDNSEPPQLYGSMPIELAWTIGPLVICFVLFLVVTRTVIDSRDASPPPGALRVIAVGHQWWWELRYPDLGIVTANELHVPVASPDERRPVYIELQSADVIHSFWVPRLAGKTDLIPARKNFLWFDPVTEGTFLGQCAEYCGTQHAGMLLRVVVEPKESFDKWAANEAKDAVNDPARSADRDLFLSEACMNCHTIRGTTAKGLFGPDLTHLMSRVTIASGLVENNFENLRQWVFDAQSLKEGCRMPSFHLSEDQATSIARYLETLR